MYPFTLISSQQGASGYPEDDWQRITYISNEKDLLKALKKGYLKDANNRNDFPICSFPINRAYVKGTKIPASYGTVQLGGYENFDGEYISGPTDYRNVTTDFTTEEMASLDKIHKKFDKWKSRLQTLIPGIRKISKNIKEKEYDLKTLKELAVKYGYSLVKD